MPFKDNTMEGSTVVTGDSNKDHSSPQGNRSNRTLSKDATYLRICTPAFRDVRFNPQDMALRTLPEDPLWDPFFVALVIANGRHRYNKSFLWYLFTWEIFYDSKTFSLKFIFVLFNKQQPWNGVFHLFPQKTKNHKYLSFTEDMIFQKHYSMLTIKSLLYKTSLYSLPPEVASPAFPQLVSMCTWGWHLRGSVGRWGRQNEMAITTNTVTCLLLFRKSWVTSINIKWVPTSARLSTRC